MKGRANHYALHAGLSAAVLRQSFDVGGKYSLEVSAYKNGKTFIRRPKSREEIKIAGVGWVK